MGNQVSSAQYLALGSFLVNVGTQTYGMLTSPNMKDIADAVRPNAAPQVTGLSFVPGNVNRSYAVHSYELCSVSSECSIG